MPGSAPLDHLRPRDGSGGDAAHAPTRPLQGLCRRSNDDPHTPRFTRSRLGDLGSKHILLREGIGWGYMPEPMVREVVEAGRLVHLDLPEVRRGSLRLYAIYRTDAPPGPAGSWLIARFQAQAGLGPHPDVGDRQVVLTFDPGV